MKKQRWIREVMKMMGFMKHQAVIAMEDDYDKWVELEIAYIRMIDLCVYALKHDLPDPLAWNVSCCEYVDLGGEDNEGNEENHVQDR